MEPELQPGDSSQMSSATTTQSSGLQLEPASSMHALSSGLLLVPHSQLQLGDSIQYVMSPIQSDSLQYALVRSQTRQTQASDSVTVSPQFVLIEDPGDLQSYADFASSLTTQYTSASVISVSKSESVTTAVDRDLSSHNFHDYFITDTTSMPSHAMETNTVVIATRSPQSKDTILSVPVVNTKKVPSFDFPPESVGKTTSSIKQAARTDLPDSNENTSNNMSATGDSRQIKNSENLIDGDSGNLTSQTTKLDKAISESQKPDSAEAGTNTEDEYTCPEFDTDSFISEETGQDTSDKTYKEKAAFSENLGLVPADVEAKIIAEKVKYATKGVRTRRDVEKELSNLKQTEKVIDSSDINSNHVCLNSVLEGLKKLGHTSKLYKCGSCGQNFPTICKLHDHLQDHCFGGSYHYDHLLKTAYPKYDTACCYTQTNFDFDNEPILQVVNLKKPLHAGIRAKSRKLKVKLPVHKVSTPVTGKRKRGRPRKVDLLFEDVLPKTAKKDKQEGVEFMSDENADDSYQELNEEMNGEPEVPELEDIVKITDEKDTNLFHLDGTVVDSAVVCENMTQEKNAEDNSSTDLKIVTEDHESLVTDNSPEVDGDIVNKTIKSPDTSTADDTSGAKQNDSEKKKTRKRKMSIPRKVLQLYELEKHQTVSSRVKSDLKIKCEFCSSQFQYTRGLIRHEQEKHADQMKFQCDECDQKFMREYNLERHKLCTHTVGKSRFPQNRKGIYREKKKIPLKTREKSSQPTVPCTICSEEIPENKLNLHLRLHTGERPFICHVCGKGLISDKKLKRHLLIHSKVNRYKCEECGQGFSMKYKLRTHMFLHTGHKPYLCSVCGAEFNNSTSLLHHDRTVHLGDKRFECTICGGRYGKKSQLEEHMFRHSNERTQTCRYCGKTFKHAKSLRRHEHTHISDQKFQCDQCDSKFSRKDNLDRHKMCHYEATLQCSFCKKKFVERQPLVEHEEFHMKQLKYTCQLCKERFQDETYFYNHMEKSHSITQDMVPLVNTVPAAPTKEGKSKRAACNSGIKNIIFDQLKVPTSYTVSESVNNSVPQTSKIDTLNLSMSVAGILPALSSGQGQGQSVNQENMRIDQQAPNNILQQVFNIGTSTFSPRQMLNQGVNTGYASSTTGLSVMNDAQRMALNVMSSGENVAIRLSTDQQVGIALNADNVIMQEVVGNGMQNLQDQGFRMMY